MIRVLLAMLAGLAMWSCGGSNGQQQDVTGDTLTRNARLLTLVDCGEYRVADIRDPWDTTRVLQRLVIYPAGTELPADAPVGIWVETPLRNSVVLSTVHIGAIDELGAVKSVKGVADAAYLKIPEIVSGLADGTVTDVGSSMSPVMEQLLMVNPDAVLATPYEGAPLLEVKGSRTPVIAMADWMESTPLGRAEWMLLLGELYGEPVKAQKIYNQVVKDYNDIVSEAAKAKERPQVLTERLTDGVWYVPGGASYMARMVEDAGGGYLWSDDTSAGSLPLSIEQVYDRGTNADVWLIKTYGYDLSLDNLAAENPLYKRFKALSTSKVYGVNTAESMLFEEFPFHPERLLNDYYLMFHPDKTGQLRYYRHAQ